VTLKATGMSDRIQYWLLRRLYPSDPDHLTGNAYVGRSKLKALLGDDIFGRLRGKTAVDFGCGYGDQTIELAQNGVGMAVGLDVRDSVLESARNKSRGLKNITFTKPEDLKPRYEFADAIISLDAFEHFEDVPGVLREMHALLKPGGMLLASFGPPWKHPLGGHAFSPFPWAHLLLSEAALCQWYSETKNTRVSRFGDVSGGLNQMTVAHFEALAHSSSFETVRITPVPIRKLRRLHSRLTREYTTAVVTCELRKSGGNP
jgi:ubiquinone/menaquinone biosynthesis C-methylase UbiE